MKNIYQIEKNVFHTCSIPIYKQHSVQDAQLQFILPDKQEVVLKVGAVWKWTNWLIIGGWTSVPSTFQLCIEEQNFTPEFFSMTASGNDEKILFTLLLPIQPDVHLDTLLLCIYATDLPFKQAFPLRVDEQDSWSANAAIMMPALTRLIGTQEMFSPEWHLTRTLVPDSPQPCPTAAGSLDFVLHSAWNDEAIVTGWLSATKETQIWLEHDNGQVWAMHSAWHYYRKDVQNAVGNRYSCRSDKAFVLSVDAIPPYGSLHIKAISTQKSNQSKYTVCSAPVETCGYDIEELAKKSFLPTIHIKNFSEAATNVHEPVISRALEKQSYAQAQYPPAVYGEGSVPQSPLVSIIIPLYARFDFVDYQLAAFKADPWLIEHAEIIYVVDDPDILADFTVHATLLHTLYRVPFQYVWGHANRGFSGANNLGASIAGADTLLFLNSDVFPQCPDWAKYLYDTLHSLPTIGAVGARLLHTDGSLQHAGMRFRHVEELGVWVNEHPYSGCAPTQDLHTCTAPVPAVTGACMAMRKSHFETAGGWDTGYLIGDFEDSDLCMKLRMQGLEILYEPQACLTHLERQSYSFLGHEDFRQRVTLCNAVRHQRKWSSYLTQQQGAWA